MQTTTTLVMRARPTTIFPLAAKVERWPEILPHYRWVTVLEQQTPTRRLVEMAAWRDVFPLRWRAIQEVFPAQRRITFHHVAGPTTGMDVAWTLEPVDAESTRVSIWHRFEPRWPLVPDALVHVVVGEFFVGGVAGRTLRQIRLLSEAAEGRLHADWGDAEWP